MKRKGFTLIELLAVIVILAIIALIATPMILGVIESSKKGAVESSVLGYIKGIEQYYVAGQLGGSVDYLTNVDELNNVVSVKGDKPTKGSITLDEQHSVNSGEFCINGYYVVYDGKKAKVDTNKSCDDIQDPIPPTSEKCFAFENGIITDYYDYEENDRSKPTCPREVNIPSTINGEVVTILGNNSFRGLEPSFRYQPSNQEPTLMTNAAQRMADDSVSSKITAVTIPNTVTEIRHCAFLGNLLTNVTIPSSVTIIGDYAFEDNQLKSVIIPAHVTLLDTEAFAHNQLTNVQILNPEIDMGTGVFNDNQLPDDQAFFTVNYDNMKTLVSYGGAKKENVVIPNDITVIVEAFKNVGLISVTIPNSVTEIGSSAFQRNQLTSVTIPNSVTQIGFVAFSENRLTSVTIPNNVTKIGYAAFSENQLASVTISNNITKIEGYAFSDNQITSVTIPNSVIEIEDSAFSYNQLTNVTIPSNVMSIKWNAFNSNVLTSVKIVGKTSKNDFTVYGNYLWGWASGYSDSNIEWNAHV